MTKNLILDANSPAPDEIYEAIIAMHEGLSEEESATVNARMILILSNHIGDAGIIREASKLARGAR
ncbi:MAG: DUF2783 domain-containing protein [Parvularculaceae bacterium]